MMRVLKFLLWLPLYIWALPNTLVGLFLAGAYWPHSWRWSEGALEALYTRCIGSPGGQTWGWLIYYRNAYARRGVRLRRHERVHSRESLYLGIVFLLGYGLEWLGRFLFYPGAPVPVPPNLSAKSSANFEKKAKKRWFRAYYRLSWERRARRKAEQE